MSCVTLKICQPPQMKCFWTIYSGLALLLSPGEPPFFTLKSLPAQHLKLPCLARWTKGSPGELPRYNFSWRQWSILLLESFWLVSPCSRCCFDGRDGPLGEKSDILVLFLHVGASLDACWVSSCLGLAKCSPGEHAETFPLCFVFPSWWIVGISAQ